MNANIPPRWTLKARARWWVAFLRYRGDKFLTEQYAMARIIIAIALLAAMVTGNLGLQRTGAGPQHAWVQIVIYLVILIVAALIAYAMAPKPQVPDKQKAQVPVAEEGKAKIRIYGEVWIDDPMELGWRDMGADPIRKKGGKK